MHLIFCEAHLMHAPWSFQEAEGLLVSHADCKLQDLHTLQLWVEFSISGQSHFCFAVSDMMHLESVQAFQSVWDVLAFPFLTDVYGWLSLSIVLISPHYHCHSWLRICNDDLHLSTVFLSFLLWHLPFACYIWCRSRVTETLDGSTMRRVNSILILFLCHHSQLQHSYVAMLYLLLWLARSEAFPDDLMFSVNNWLEGLFPAKCSSAIIWGLHDHLYFIAVSQICFV